jgi:hypothetical protein
LSGLFIGLLDVIIHQQADSITHTDSGQGIADSPPDNVRHLPEKCEEISEDAYKQNYVYRAWTNIPPKQDKGATRPKPTVAGAR